VFSDSHGITRGIEKVLARSKYDMAIHLGDYVRDAEIIGYMFPELPVECVAGNGDYYSGCHTTQKVVEKEYARLFLTHGHLFSLRQGAERVYGIDALVDAGGKLRCDVLLFGHTHVPYCAHHGNILCVNPGSISLPRKNDLQTYAVISINGKNIDAAIMPA
jgi:putative phosphoesterase